MAHKNSYDEVGIAEMRELVTSLKEEAYALEAYVDSLELQTKKKKVKVKKGFVVTGGMFSIKTSLRHLMSANNSLRKRLRELSLGH